MPTDPAMVMSRCEFCGEDNAAPDVERRQELLFERLRADEQKRVDELERLRLENQRDARRAEREKDKRDNRQLVMWIVFAAVALLVTLLMSVLWPAPAPPPPAPTSPSSR